MKYCEEYAALLDLFVDGELAGDEMERVRAHLAECPGCQAYVDDALAIRACFPDAEETVVPEGFAEGVMERVREASGRERKIVEMKRRGVRRWLGTAAALAGAPFLFLTPRPVRRAFSFPHLLALHSSSSLAVSFSLMVPVTSPNTALLF